MKTFIFEELDIKKAMEFLDECKKKEPIQIYMYCNGGAIWQFNAFLKRLNEMLEDGYDITLKCYHASSSGFDLLYNFKGKKIIEEDCDAIVHIGRIDSSVNGRVICSNDPLERGRYEWFENKKEDICVFLTNGEIKEYLEGKDIYINPDRMKEIFKKTP